MNILEAKQEIINTVQAYLQKDAEGSYRIPEVRQRPLFLIGPPGVGKTQIIEQVASECRIGLVAYTMTHHTRQSAIGLPFIEERKYGEETFSVTQYTMSEIISSVYEKMEETGLEEGILFLDEINCVSETLAPTMLQFLQCKTFGNQHLPSGWIIVAAGNPPEYNKSVREFDMVTMDRVRKIVVEADLEVWRKYALERQIHPALLSYLKIRPKNFYRIENDVDGMQFVTARGWEDLSSLLCVYEELAIPSGEEVLSEYLQHEDVAQDVAAYLDLYYKYQEDYGIDEILAGGECTAAYQKAFRAEVDERLTVVGLLLGALNAKFDQIWDGYQILDEWYVFLQELQKRLDDMSAGDDLSVEDGASKAVYQELSGEWMNRFRKEEKSGFYNVRQQRQKRQLSSLLREGLTVDGKSDGGNVFEQYRMSFDKAQGDLEELEQTALTQLNNAFAFVESAFEKGQEMVVFVTELTMGEASSYFLSQNECPKYLAYSGQLLMGKRKTDLVAEMTE